MTNGSNVSVALRRRIRTEGAEAAFEALLKVCRDPKSTSQALSSAGSAIFRAAGLLDRQEDTGERQPSEMSYDELQAAIARLRRGESVAGDDDPEGENSVFD